MLSADRKYNGNWTPLQKISGELFLLCDIAPRDEALEPFRPWSHPVDLGQGATGSDLDQAVPHGVVLLLLPLEFFSHGTELLDDFVAAIHVVLVHVAFVPVAHRGDRR